MKNKKQKEHLTLVIIVIAVAVLGIVGYFVLRNDGTPSYVPVTQQQEQAPIENDSDLQEVFDDLDNADIDGMGNELNQNDKDASAL